MTSRSKKGDYASAFGRALDEQLAKRGMRQSEIAAATAHSPSYVNQTMTGKKPVPPQWVDLVADVIRATPEERAHMHRGAALDHGFKIDLTAPPRPADPRPEDR